MAAEPAWRDVVAIDALEPEWVTRVEAAGRVLAIYDTPSGIRASSALCSHGGADLCDGWFDGRLIECPLHQGAFDVRDGRPVSAPATRPLRMFEARVRDGVVQVLI